MIVTKRATLSYPIHALAEGVLQKMKRTQLYLRACESNLHQQPSYDTLLRE